MNIAILTGGESSERQVALWSADYVEESLRDRVQTTRFVLPEQMKDFIAQRENFDAIIPVLHGRGGEDGVLQGFLKTLGIPFVFSGVEAHAVGMNKALAKQMAGAAGVQTAPWQVARDSSQAAFTSACVVKPLHGGSTIATTVVRRPEELEAAVKLALEQNDDALVETFVSGREFTVGIIEEQGVPVALPVIEIIAANGNFDFDAKYTEGKMAQEICPAQIPIDLRARLQASALAMHQVIGARHASRSDFIVDVQGQEWFLEINTIPGMTKNSLLPKAVRASGRDFGDLLVTWCEEAKRRQHGSK